MSNEEKIMSSTFDADFAKSVVEMNEVVDGLVSVFVREAKAGASEQDNLLSLNDAVREYPFHVVSQTLSVAIQRLAELQEENDGN